MTVKIQLTQDDYLKCVSFAEKVVNTNADQYARRNQTDLNKIRKDVITGKLGEIAVYKLLLNNGFYCSYPDFDVYTKDKKSYDADLECNGYYIHVKCQNIESANKYGISWMFQRSGAGSGHSDPVLQSSSEKDLAAFLTVDLVTLKVTSHWFDNISLLQQKNLFREPRLEKLKGIKSVIYLEDLQETLK